VTKLRARLALTACFTTVFLAVAGSAGAQDAAQAKCRASLAKNTNKYLKAVVGAVTKCHLARDNGSIAESTDCNDPSTADSAGKLPTLRAKAQASMIKACQDSLGSPVPGILAMYARCPSPSETSDDGGATAGIDGVSELAACLLDLQEDVSTLMTTDVLGLPDEPVGEAGKDCRAAVAKGLAKAVVTIGKERAKCQKGADKLGGPIEYDCVDQDPSGKIDAAVDALAAAVTAACVPTGGSDFEQLQSIDRFGLCADRPAQLVDCIANKGALLYGSGLIATAYELPDTCRAGGLRRTGHARIGSQLTGSSLSAGYNGLAHAIDLNDAFHDAVDLDCNEDCSSCAVSLDARKDQPDSFCRCVNDSSISCDVVNGPDTDDCPALDNRCRCFFGPPLPVSVSSAPTCEPVLIMADYEGTTDVNTGELDQKTLVSALIHLGEVVDRPCPTCEGDVTPNDGVRDGECLGGARDGQPCDTNGVHSTFGSHSHDCQPPPVKNISGGSGLLLDFNFTTTQDVLPYNLPCDDPGEMCPCRVCSGDNSIGCNDDSFCAANGAGTCTAGGGAGVHPNACDNLDCGADGFCTEGPVRTYCDGKTHADGRGYITCTTDADCFAHDAGTCSDFQELRCFTNPVVAEGESGFLGQVLGTAACIGLTSNTAINLASGLPSAVRVILDTDTEVRCASDPDVVYAPPTGANCP